MKINVTISSQHLCCSHSSLLIPTKPRLLVHWQRVIKIGTKILQVQSSFETRKILELRVLDHIYKEKSDSLSEYQTRGGEEAVSKQEYKMFDLDRRNVVCAQK